MYSCAVYKYLLAHLCILSVVFRFVILLQPSEINCLDKVLFASDLILFS